MHAASVAPPVPAFFGMVGPPVPTRPPGASPHGFMFSRGPGIMQWHEQLAVHAPPLHPEACECCFFELVLLRSGCVYFNASAALPACPACVPARATCDLVA